MTQRPHFSSHSRAGLFSALVLSVLSASAAAQTADEPRCESGDYVRLRIKGAERSTVEGERLVEHLRAGLAVSEIKVCLAAADDQNRGEGDGEEQDADDREGGDRERSGSQDRGTEYGGAVAAAVHPLATVRITLHEKADFQLALEVEDAVTVKKVVRNLDLQEIPEDSRALAIAIHIEELLRASWAEVLLQRQAPGEKRAPPPPKVVQKTVERAEVRKRTSFRYSLGGGGAYYTANLWFFGPSFRLGYAPLDWLETSVRFAPRWSSPVTVSSGEVQAQNVLLAAGMRVLSASVDRVRLVGDLEIRGQYVTMMAMADEGFEARSGSGWGMDIALGGGLSLPLGTRLSIDVLAHGLIVASSVTGLEFGDVVTGLAGGGAEIGLALGGRL